MEAPRALKVDVQGAEYELILGSSQVLKEFKYIFIEIAVESLYIDSSDPDKLINLLKNKGFSIHLCYNRLYSNSKLLSIDYLFIRDWTLIDLLIFNINYLIY